ncbi:MULTISPECIES: response regulator [unclassified Pseudomonas]|uniref:response regulator n=1 Tax=unclassified Pseudomonas TaxID=196821 RepID=UPI002AC8E67B|nr:MULTISPECIES: response regulator [unclassified Pseudomonas]MEB0047017.1 response regulator [Pseudomonas sp. Dout3]MEB0097831.1 response regulator [Pseudomonas sp. DC1.2]WPX57222.1 response regulator [Pseudomonas sp. DC1.2]
MSNKALRILIADEQHFHRMKIERLFNQLDYYRVAPVQNVEELLNLVEYGLEPFDLVVINAALAAGAFDLLGFFLDNPQVRHALIYQGESIQLPPIPACREQKVQVSHGLMPDFRTIERLMAIIDPAVSERGRRWLPERCDQKTG